jgi:hypothetical protein
VAVVSREQLAVERNKGKRKEVSSSSQKQKELLGVYNITKPSYERILSDASAEVYKSAYAVVYNSFATAVSRDRAD